MLFFSNKTQNMLFLGLTAAGLMLLLLLMSMLVGWSAFKSQ